jgi:hypothetical protein
MSFERTPAELMNPPPTFEESFTLTLSHAALIYEGHNRTKRDSWKDKSIMELEEMLQKEVKEYLSATGLKEMFAESLDIVNFALMIATRRMVEVPPR